MLKQANIFGEYFEISVKQKRKCKKNQKLKQKIKILYELYEQLYEKQNISPIEYRDIIIKGTIIIYPEERQAEPIEAINLTLDDIDKRINIMQEAVK